MKKLSQNAKNLVLSNRTVLQALIDLSPFGITHSDIERQIKGGNVTDTQLNVISAHLRLPSHQLLEPSTPQEFEKALEKAQKRYFNNLN